LYFVKYPKIEHTTKGIRSVWIFVDQYCLFVFHFKNKAELKIKTGTLNLDKLEISFVNNKKESLGW
jgi:hypothetical protein